MAKKKIPDNQVKKLLKDGKISAIKGFTSKAGKSFEAALKLDESFKVKFEFDK